MDKDFTFTVELFGIKSDGSNDIQSIEADSSVEVEIIIESFHDDGYRILSCTCNFSGNYVSFL